MEAEAVYWLKERGCHRCFSAGKGGALWTHVLLLSVGRRKAPARYSGFNSAVLVMLLASPLYWDVPPCPQLVSRVWSFGAHDTDTG